MQALLDFLSDEQVQKTLVKLFYIVGKYALTGGVIPTDPLELITFLTGECAESAAIEGVEELGVALSQNLTTVLVKKLIDGQFDLSEGELQLLGEVWELLAYGPDDELKKELSPTDIRKLMRSNFRSHLRNVPKMAA